MINIHLNPVPHYVPMLEAQICFSFSSNNFSYPSRISDTMLSTFFFSVRYFFSLCWSFRCKLDTSSSR